MGVVLLALLPAVAQAAPSANDRFVDSAGLTGETAIGESSTVDATFDQGESQYYSGGSVWWSWTAPVTATVQVDSCGSEHPTPLTIWTGSAVNSLNWVGEASGGCNGIPATFEAQAGVTYRVAAYGEDGAGAVKLRINAAPINDDFADALSLNPLIEDRWLMGTTRRATREQGEPVHAGAAPGGSVWYRWTAGQTGVVKADTCNSWDYGSDTVIGVYTGSGPSALTTVASNDDDSSCFASGGSSVSFLATAGVEYHLAVAGKAGQSPVFGLSVSPPPAHDAFAQPWELTDEDGSDIAYAWGDTRRATSEPNEPAHAGAPAASSLWHRWTAPADGPVRVLVCGWSVDPRAAVYAGTELSSLSSVATGVSSTCGSESFPAPGPGQTSTTPTPPSAPHAVELSFDAEAGRTYRIAVDSVGGSGGSFNLSLYTRPANDRFAAARSIDDSLYVSGSTRLATVEQGEPVHAGTGSGHSLWFEWTAETTGVVVPSACPWMGDESAALAIYSGDRVDALTEVASGRKRPSGCVEASFLAEAGTTYRIAVADESGATDFELWLQQPPSNDALAAARPISGSDNGDNRYASKEPGEPDHAGSPGGRSVWFRWTPTETGRVTVSTCDAYFDTLVAVYSGDPDGGFAALTQRGAADGGCNDFDSYGSRLALDVVAGTEYLIAVDGRDEASGWFALDLEPLGPANDDFESPTALSGADATVSGSTASASREIYEPAHAGGAGQQSVWHRWKAPSNGSGTVTFDTCGSSFDTVLAVYTGSDVTNLSPVASNNDDCGSASRVSFAYEPGETYRIAVDSWAAASGSYQLKVAATVPQSDNDAFAAARAIEGAGAIVAGNTTGATKEAGEPDHAGDPGGGSVWYRWTATADGPATLDTCGSEIDTLLGVYSGAAVDALDEVAASDDAGPCTASNGASALTFAAVAGVTYRIAVDGKGGAAGEIVLRLNRPANDDFASAIAVAAPHAQLAGTTLGATVEVGEPSAYPTATSSVWYRWTAPQTKRVAVHTCAAPGSSMGVKVFRGSSLSTLMPTYGSPLSGSYSTDCAGAYFGGASSGLSLDVVAGITYSIAVDAPPAGWAPGLGWGSPGPFTLAIGAPLNDLQIGPERILGPDAEASGSNAGATTEVGEWPQPGGGASVWYRWFATASGPVTVDTCASSIDTLLAVHSRPAPAVPGEPSPPPPAPLAENDDSGACSNASRSSVTFDAVEGTQYMLAVAGKGGATGPIAIAVDLQAPDVTAPETAQLASGPIFTPQSSISLGLLPDELGSAFECSVDEGAFTTCSPPYGAPYYYDSDTVYLSVIGLAEGEHTLDVRERDLAGNVDPTPARAAVHVDKTAPDTVIDSAPESHTRDHTVSFGYSGTEPVMSFGCSIDGEQRGCSSSGVQSFSGLAEGSHSFEVWASDRAGNVDLTPAVHDFTIDRTAPVVEIVAAPVSPTRSRDVRFEFEVDDPDATTRCRLQRSGPATVPFAGCTSPVEPAALIDGAYSFIVEATDAAGNVDVESRQFTVDTRPPRSSFGQAPPQHTNDATPAFAFVADEEVAGFRCSLDDEPFAACDTPVVTDALPDGEHSFAVEATDVAGNVEDPPLRRTFTVDTAPPDAAVVSGPDGLTRELGPFGLSSSEPLGRFECSVDDGPFAICSSQYTLPSLPDGEHTLAVRAVDRAGNADPTPAERTIQLDRTAPVTTIGDGPLGTVDTPDVAFAFSADEPASFVCQFDGGFTVDCNSPRAYSALRDGEHSFSVHATDLAGNVESPSVERPFRVEARPPETTLLATPDAYTPATDATFDFDSDELGSTFECSLDDGEFETCAPDAVLSGLADGERRFRVRAVDLAGKRDPTPAQFSWTVDTDPPQAAIESGPSGPTKTAGPFHFAADEPTIRFECAVDDDAFSFCGSGHVAGGLEDGEHTFRVRAVDRAGNHDAEPAARSFRLDTVAPTVTITSAPGETSGRTVAIGFEASEDDATFACRLDGDGNGYAPCDSPVSYGPLTDGPYSASIRATDAAGNTGAATAVEFVVDVEPPETTITGGPPSATNQSTVELRFGGTDAERFRCSLDDGDYGDCSSPKTYSGLADGHHRFRVYAVDAVGNDDPTPAERTFVVDTNPPDTEITDGPAGPLHGQASFSYRSTEGGGIECTVDDRPYVGCNSGIYLPGVGGGEHVFRARAVDPAGNTDPTPATRTFRILNERPVVDLDVSSDGGPARLDLEAAFGAEDLDGDELRYSLQLGDGTEHDGVLPDGPIAHRYDEPGIYTLRLEVDDGFDVVVATRTVTVTLPEPLEPKAGDDQTVVAGEPVVLDGADSRPLRGIDAYSWRFSDDSPAEDGAVVEHTYEEPGTYAAELTVTGPGETASDSAQIKVLPRPGGDGVRVDVQSAGAPVAGADVLAILPDGERISAVSGATGIAKLYGLPDGEHKVYAYKPGYLPATGNATAADGEGSGEVQLQAGEVATAEVESRRLTLDEIIAAGIDPDDPDNQHVSEFEVHLDVVASGGGGSSGGGGGGSGGFAGWATRGGLILPPGSPCVRIDHYSCSVRTGRVTVIHRTAWVEDTPIVSSLVIPFKATWLKEFYEVSLIVSNLGAPDFTLEQGHATIGVPSGMSLAPTSQQQALTTAVPDIPGGQSASARWVLRGDKEGEYHLAASYAGSLAPFGRVVRVEGKTVEPIKVWGGSALELVVDVDEQVSNGYPFTVFVKLKNVSDVPVYNPAVELLKAGRVGYIEQPRQQRKFQLRELAPGATHNAGPFVLVPEPSGNVNLADSFIRKTAGDVDLGGTIVTHEREPSLDETPTISSHARKDAVVFDLEGVPDATGYEIFATPDRETDFPDAPLPGARVLKPNKILVPVESGQPRRWFAASTLRPGRNQEMIHPLVTDEPTSAEIWPSMEASIGSCEAEDQDLTVTMEDPDVDLTRWRYKIGEQEWIDGGALNDSIAIRTIAVEIGDDPTTVRVQAQNAEHAVGAPPIDATPDDWGGPVVTESLGRCNYVALGDSVSAGEGIGYGYEWEDGPRHWEDKTPDGETWDTSKHDAVACHQSTAAHPRKLATAAGLRLTHLSCTGATFDKGIAGRQDKEGVERAQVGGFEDEGDDPNPDLATAKPDWVTLSLGANDIEFADIVAACFYPGSQLPNWVPKLGKGTCNFTLSRAEDRLADGHVAERLEKTYRRLARLATDAGRSSVVLHTEYVDPFPDVSQSQDCFDMQGGGAATGYSRADVNRMRAGLEALNEIIREQAEQADGVIAVPASPEFEQHRFCSSDPWVYGMDTAIDWQMNDRDRSPVMQAPFHPTVRGQAEIAEQLERYVASGQPGHAGTDVEVSYPGGAQLHFAEITRAGATLVVEVAEPTLPEHRAFTVRQGYQIESAASHTGSIQVTLPAQPGDRMWHYTGGSWEDVQATYAGGALQGTVQSLSPFAVGPEVEEQDRVTARITGGEGGVVPKDVTFSAAASEGPVESVEWDFGDGTTGTGTDVAHRYVYSGSYEVVATVESADGAIDRATTTVTIVNPGPVFAGEVPASVRVGDELVLDSSASTDPNGEIAGGWWEVDGVLVEPEGQQSSVRFDEPGAVTVEGIVRDDELKEARQAFEVLVLPASDTTPPDTTITSGPTGAIASATATFGFSASEPGALFECRVGGVFAACSSPFTTGPLANGAYTFEVRASDQAGNVDLTPAARSFSVDVAATGSSPPPSSTAGGSTTPPPPSQSGPAPSAQQGPATTASCKRALAVRKQAQSRMKSLQRKLRGARRTPAKRSWRRAIAKHRKVLSKAKRQAKRACAPR